MKYDRYVSTTDARKEEFAITLIPNTIEEYLILNRFWKKEQHVDVSYDKCRETFTIIIDE